MRLDQNSAQISSVNDEERKAFLQLRKRQMNDAVGRRRRFNVDVASRQSFDDVVNVAAAVDVDDSRQDGWKVDAAHRSLCRQNFGLLRFPDLLKPKVKI
jgi:hypothetical protein